MSIIVKSVEEIVEIVANKTAEKQETLKEAALDIQTTIMNTPKDEVNYNFRHQIILIKVCKFIALAKENYKGGILIEIPEYQNIPGSCALGCAIGLMETWCSINEIPWNSIDRLEEDAYDFESWYDGDEDDKDIKEAKNDEKKSINLHRFWYVRGLVGAVMNSLGYDWSV